MKTIVNQSNILFLRFDQGEEVIELLQRFCRENSITSGSFHALGACGELLLSYYNLETKTYEDKTIKEDLEIASMVGNIALMNNEIIVHTHGVFGRQDLSTIGGHIKKLIVSATCEITLTTFEKDFTRSYDEKTGLNLLT